MLSQLIIFIIAGGFAAMGVAGLVAPHRIVAQFDIASLSPAGRNEVRAVYGGFGLTIAAMLTIALTSANLRSGICLTVAWALLGMAGGRIASMCIDRTLPRWAHLYLVIESLAGLLLLYARTHA